ncbi:NAD(P)-binding domain-containing protein [Cupriavidus basilensis]|uniref:NAD(P)-binding domain-containing protein n=1 Tax=Cupriavidus basilensis TaxID=68895 RepID=UPI001F2D89E4|nr:NAD(P)-binding domain-containing protein [Cupriavidus basilensis]
MRVANSSAIEGVRAFAREIGAEPRDVHGAITGADVVVLAIPLPAMREPLAAAIPGVATMKRDQLPEHFAKLGPNASHADVVAMNRRVNSVVG